ncbi:MAG: hypothetical protein JWL83_4535 [Actinomycetia bacterium]|nr:hypothetical protein [Actinomycetes bacterium]
MPYPRRLLNEGEDVALDLRPHWWFFAHHIFTGVPLLVVFFLIIVSTSGDAQRNLLWVWLVLAIAWVIWLGLKYLAWNFTHFVVTTDRVVFRTGVLGKRGVEIPLDRINNINFRQNIFERIIGAGDLEIESAGKDGQSTFSNVRHPDGVQQEVYRQAEVNARKRAGWSGTGGPAPATAPASPAAPVASNPDKSVPEQLEQLASLRDRGIITAVEFEAKKAQLLERM